MYMCVATFITQCCDTAHSTLQRTEVRRSHGHAAVVDAQQHILRRHVAVDDLRIATPGQHGVAARATVLQHVQHVASQHSTLRRSAPCCNAARSRPLHAAPDVCSAGLQERQRVEPAVWATCSSLQHSTNALQHGTTRLARADQVQQVAAACDVPGTCGLRGRPFAAAFSIGTIAAETLWGPTGLVCVRPVLPCALSPKR
jgi:hypothetical protein